MTQTPLHALEAPPPFLPLRLVEEHFDALEGLWARRAALTFDKRATLVDLRALDRRLQAHISALQGSKDAALCEAALRMASPAAGEGFVGTWVTALLDPSAVTSDAVRLRPRRAEVLLGALSAAGRAVVLRLSPTVPAFAALRARWEAPAEDLLAEWLAHDSAPVRREGLRCYARRPCAGLLGRVAQLALHGMAEERPLALLALAAGLGNRVDDASFAGWVEVALGDGVFETAPITWLVALFGHVPTGLRIAQRIRASGPTAELVFALGWLGLGSFAPLLVEVLGSGDALLEREALRALHTLSGVWFVEGDLHAMRDDGQGSTPDAAAAKQWLADLGERANRRMFMGRLLDAAAAEDEPLSLGWMRDINGGGAHERAVALPDGLLGPRKRPVGWWELGPPKAAEVG